MILVDALNLIHSVPSLKRLLETEGLQAAERKLLGVCSRWVRGTPQKREVVLVFDGNRPRGVPVTPPAPGLSARYVPNADQDLLELLGRRGGDHLLVSRDAELVQAAARSMAPREWFERMIDELAGAGEARDKTRQLSAGEVDEWLEFFGEAPRRKPRRASPPAGGLPPEQVDEWLDYFGG